MSPTTYETTRTEDPHVADLIVAERLDADLIVADRLDADLRLAMEMESPPELSPAFTPRSWPATAVVAESAHVVPPTPRPRVLARLLAMADSYLRAGSLRQAMEMYFDLYRSYPDTPEAILAENRILKVARRHEEEGELHSARAIYEQLL
jgi:hypothetical protein